MKHFYIIIFFLLIGCKWEIPEIKSLKECSKPTSVSFVVDPTNPRKYSFTLNDGEIKYPITWQFAGNNIGTSTTNTFSYTFSTDGNFSVTALYSTNCGDIFSLNSSNFNVTIQPTIEKSFPLTDPMVSPGLRALTVTNNGTIIGSNFDEIKVWNYSQNNLLRSFKGHSGTGDISNLLLSSDEKYLISTSTSDNDIIVWDWQSGTQIRKLTGNSSSFNSLNISADNKYLVGGSKGKNIKIWRVDDGTLFKNFTISNSINSISISNEGKLIAAITEQNTCRIFDGITGLEQWSFTKGTMNNVQINSIGTELWVCGKINQNSYLETWNINNKNLIKSYENLNIDNYSMKLSNKGDYILVGHELYDTQTRTKLWNKNNNFNFGVDYSAISANNLYVATGSSNGSISMALLSNGERIENTTNKHRMVNFRGYISADEKTLFTNDFVAIKFWDLTTGVLKNTINTTGYDTAIANDGVWLRSCGLTKYDFNGNSVISANVNYCNGYFAEVEISKDEKYIAVEGNNGTILLFNQLNGVLIKTLTSHSNYISFLGFTPDSKYLISSSQDNTIKIWDLSNNTLLRTLTISGSLGAIAINSNNQTINVNVDNSLITYEFKSGEILSSININNFLNKIATSPNNVNIIGSNYNRLMIFDPKNGTLLKEKKYDSNINSIFFNSSGTQIYVTTHKDFYVIPAP